MTIFTEGTMAKLVLDANAHQELMEWRAGKGAEWLQAATHIAELQPVAQVVAEQQASQFQASETMGVELGLNTL